MRSQINLFRILSYTKGDAKWEKSRKCDIFEKDFHRSSNAKRLKSKKDLENEGQKVLILQERFLTE